MKTTITIETPLLEDLLSYTQAKTNKEAIFQAIQEYIRYKQREELLSLRGKLEIEDNRPLGLLKKTDKCVIKEDFKITDEEFFQL